MQVRHFFLAEDHFCPEWETQSGVETLTMASEASADIHKVPSLRLYWGLCARLLARAETEHW